MHQIGDVVRGGLAIHRGIQREDDLLHRRVMGARNERVDGQVLRTDAVERRQRAAQHVIPRMEHFGTLERPEIGDVRHHHNHRRIAPRIGAHRAWVLGVDVAAGAAHLDLFDRGLQGRGERRHQRLALLDEMQRRAARRARTEPRQPCQELDQTLDLGTCRDARHAIRTA